MAQNEQQNNKMLWGNPNNGLVALFAIIAIVFVFFRMMYIIFQNDPEQHLQDYNNLYVQFAMPLEWKVFAKRPWTLLTYMFTNTGYLNVITNAVWVMGFGYITQILVGNKHIIPAFMYGALAGGIALLLTNGTVSAVVSGSELGILSLATTLAVANNGSNLFNGLPNKVFTLLLAILYTVILWISSSKGINYILAYCVTIATGAAYGMAVLKKYNPGAPLYLIHNALLGRTGK